MEPALSLEQLQNRVEYKYEKDEHRVVGIMLARYDLSVTKKLIDECYQYWHDNTGDSFDVFWAGYGEYLPPSEQSKTKIILNFAGNDKRAYYDSKAFITIKRKLSDALSRSYNDHIQLALVNYCDGKLHFKESVLIDLEQNLDENLAAIREIMEWITNECWREGDVIAVLKRMKQKEVLEKIKGISASDVISNLIGIAGLKLT